MTYRDSLPIRPRGYNRAKKQWRKLWKFRGYKRTQEITREAETA